MQMLKKINISAGEGENTHTHIHVRAWHCPARFELSNEVNEIAIILLLLLFSDCRPCIIFYACNKVFFPLVPVRVRACVCVSCSMFIMTS